MSEDIAEIAGVVVPCGYMLTFDGSWVFRHKTQPLYDYRPNRLDRIKLSAHPLARENGGAK